MPLLLTITEGTTRRRTFTIMTALPGAVAAAFNGSGFTLSNLYLTDKFGNAVTTSGDFGWLSDAAGTVYYDPDAADFDADKSPYLVQFELTDGAGAKEIVPTKGADEILVKPLRK